VSFTSLAFAVFFVVVYACYLLLARSTRAQNALLLVASWVFYGWWDWRFLGLLLASTAVDFCVGLALEREGSPRRRKALLYASLAFSLGTLAVFKYLGFFAESATELLRALGLTPSLPVLHVVLPVGISFYTFQTMSYVVDVYRGRPASRSPLELALFVAFFPQLVAGPIERAGHLLGQLARPRVITWDQVSAGTYLIAWGYFKKLVVADHAALVADRVFAPEATFQGLDVVLGVLAFSAQIYGDFSGYTDIARGAAKLFGIELSLNFRLPYLADSPGDFWRRWHISLSAWLRDYLYIPLGGDRGGALRTQRNLLLTMLLGGLWHGAAWHFVLWGLYHGLLLVAYRAVDRPTASRPLAVRALRVGVMFIFTSYGWLLFRAQSFDQIVAMTSSLGLARSPDTAALAWGVLLPVTPLLVLEAAQQWTGDLLAPLRLPVGLRGAFVGALVLATLAFGARTPIEFIYFQF
jgi:alginate O-acetyltransferase complex protein AlgI